MTVLLSRDPRMVSSDFTESFEWFGIHKIMKHFITKRAQRGVDFFFCFCLFQKMRLLRDEIAGNSDR